MWIVEKSKNKILFETYDDPEYVIDSVAEANSSYVVTFRRHQ